MGYSLFVILYCSKTRARSSCLRDQETLIWFDTFLVKVDRQDWKPSARAFDWRLHPGRNRVEMRTRTTAGVEGPVSVAEVEYKTDDQAKRTR